MIEQPRCPRCGVSLPQTEEGVSVLCPACGTDLGDTPQRPVSSTECPQGASLSKAEVCPGERCGQPSAKFCPRCGAKLEIRMRFCDRCGGNYVSLSSPDGRCHWCGHQSSADSELCGNCGARLITVCPQCRSQMKAGLNYCASCGLDYQKLFEEQANGDQEEREENSQR
jgi:predicted RNA-binding Zn-ribbon protein involved in translation (DUF1610 family)